MQSVRKVAKHYVFPMIRRSGGSKSRLAKAAGAEILKSKCPKHTSTGALLEVRLSNNCTPLWHEAHFQVKIFNK